MGSFLNDFKKEFPRVAFRKDVFTAHNHNFIINIVYNIQVFEILVVKKYIYSR
jgi:hypothetical protein